MGIGFSDIKDNNGKSIMRVWVIYEKDLALFSNLEGKSKYGEKREHCGKKVILPFSYP